VDKYIVNIKYIIIVFEILLSTIIGCNTVEMQKNNSCIFGDCRNGYGIQRSEKGIYLGEYKNAMANGHGIFHYDNGQKYVGTWMDDNKNTGSLITGNGTYRGVWQKEPLEGDFTFTSPEISFSGTIKYVFKIQEILDIEKYHGKVKDIYWHYSYIPHGYCEFTWADGSFYKGKLGCYNISSGSNSNPVVVCGLPKGEGECCFQGGTHLKGIFSDFKSNKIIVYDVYRPDIPWTEECEIQTESKKFRCLIEITINKSPGIFKILSIKEIN